MSNLRTPAVFEILKGPTDDYNETEEIWEPFANVRVEIREINGRELVDAQQTWENVTGKITARYRQDLTSEMRIRDLVDDTIWHIAAIVRDEERRWLTFMVSR